MNMRTMNSIAFQCRSQQPALNSTRTSTNASAQTYLSRRRLASKRQKTTAMKSIPQLRSLLKSPTLRTRQAKLNLRSSKILAANQKRRKAMSLRARRRTMMILTTFQTVILCRLASQFHSQLRTKRLERCGTSLSRSTSLRAKTQTVMTAGD